MRDKVDTGKPVFWDTAANVQPCLRRKARSAAPGSATDALTGVTVASPLQRQPDRYALNSLRNLCNANILANCIGQHHDSHVVIRECRQGSAEAVYPAAVIDFPMPVQLR